MSDHTCVRCKRELPHAAFDRTLLGAYTDGGLAAWCNECYLDPLWPDYGKLDKRPMRHISELAAVRPWAGHRAKKATDEGDGR